MSYKIGICWSIFVVFSKKGQLYKRALTCYENAMRCAQDDATTYNNYALCLDEMGRYEEALDFYERALALNPCSKKTLQNKAVCLYKSGLHRESIEVCDEVLVREPGRIETWGGGAKG